MIIAFARQLIFVAFAVVVLVSNQYPARAQDHVTVTYDDPSQDVTPQNIPARPEQFSTQKTILLQQNPVVDAPFIKVGDLFLGLHADEQEIRVAHSPSPGKRTEFPVQVLVELSERYNLGWKPLSTQDRLWVLRASLTIDRKQIETELIQAIRHSMPTADKISITLDNPNVVLHLPTNSPAQLIVDSIDVDHRTQNFVATLVVPLSGRKEERLTVTGTAKALISVPVAAMRLERNRPIVARDLSFESHDAARLNPRILIDPADIIGKSPRRSLMPGSSFLNGSLKITPLVLKGAMVAIIYSIPSMTLTAKGQALEEGGMGEVIRVTNTQSNRSIMARVVGLEKVSVAPTGGFFGNRFQNGGSMTSTASR